MALLAQGLSQQKFELHLVLVTQTREEIKEELESGGVPAGVEVYALGERRVRAGALSILRLVWRLRPRAQRWSLPT